MKLPNKFKKYYMSEAHDKSLEQYFKDYEGDEDQIKPFIYVDKIL